MRVTTREHGRDYNREYISGELAVIPPNVPHTFTFLNRTVMAEWWTGGTFETRYYRPYRREVDAALARLRQKPLEQHSVPRAAASRRTRRRGA